MRILLLGGTRFIGPHVMKRLAYDGHDIAIFNRGLSDPKKLPAGLLTIAGDRARLGDYRREFDSFSPDVVLDMFPYTEREAQLVMETFAGIAGRVVAVSSCDVYRAFGKVNGIETGPIEEGLLTEDSPLCEKRYPFRDRIDGREDYDKVLVEKVVMNHPELPGSVIRLPMVYGPGDYQHRPYPYLQQMLDGRRTILLEEEFSEWRWTRGYVEDIAHAISLVTTDKRASGRVYHVGEDAFLTMKEWIVRIAQAVGWKGEIVTMPARELPEFMRIQIDSRQHILLDTSRIRSELGYRELCSADEAMRRTIEWESAHPPKKVPGQTEYDLEDECLANRRTK